ncbi:CotS family spore coat protein [Paenibacillus thiaminolyticus]|uniref:CotS family spore coat protein n=1 Tax=Paenibacillus thiaminolyticus TaxID=49283 RepID=A0A3A3GH19_PANTH|nr:CotS family spore coat protein [Paenibacillus thiaminolyticus]RJG23096.1 CotS family spore coat protein [Paenibacillus thiaminolyticus]
MEQYQIGPWEHLIHTVPPGTILEQYVPPEVEEVARLVMSQYDMQVSSMVLITSKPDKGGAIWRIDTDKGPRSLKVLHRVPSRSLFSIGAQQYLVEQGARVPALIPTTGNENYVEAGGKLWIVTDWIEQMQPVSKIDLEGAATLCYGLGEFHRLSKGYVPPARAGKSSRLYTWPKYYEKIIAKIGWFRDIANAYDEFPASQQLRGVVDEFERQAREALERLHASKYVSMTAMGEPHWGLVHQDYGWSNGQMGPGGIWVIDLDGVAYDFPFRDLRKLITSTMDDMGIWDMAWIRGMIGAYHEANPMDREMFELLCLDMAFPNEFYKHVKEVVFDPVTFLSMELEPILQRVLATESTKWQALAELAADAEQYAPGDYSTPAPAASWRMELPYSVLNGEKLPVIEVPAFPHPEPSPADTAGGTDAAEAHAETQAETQEAVAGEPSIPVAVPAEPAPAEPVHPSSVPAAAEQFAVEHVAAEPVAVAPAAAESAAHPAPPEPAAKPDTAPAPIWPRETGTPRRRRRTGRRLRASAGRKRLSRRRGWLRRRRRFSAARIRRMKAVRLARRHRIARHYRKKSRFGQTA